MFNYYIEFYSNDNFIQFYSTINNLICDKYESHNLILQDGRWVLDCDKSLTSPNFNDSQRDNK